MASQGETLREKASRLMNEYEALGARPGGESAYAEAMTTYQQLLGEHPGDARLHLEYGYLQECHGRNLIRAAAGCYERAIELDPGWDKPHYQLIFARSALHESERVIELYKQRLAAAPDQIREYRFLAGAYLRSGALDEAGRVIAAGRTLNPATTCCWRPRPNSSTPPAAGRRHSRHGGRSNNATPKTSAPTS